VISQLKRGRARALSCVVRRHSIPFEAISSLTQSVLGIMHSQISLNHVPASVRTLQVATEELGFSMGSDPGVGSLLRTLVALKPGGAFLELGTGTGLATAWMLDGMDRASTLLSIDLEAEPLAVAKQHLATDPRVTFVHGDGGRFLAEAAPESFDLIFADAWPGKFTHLDEAVAALRTGGIYLIDDLLPQPNWPQEHPAKVERLLAGLANRDDLRLTYLAWSTGIVLGTKAPQ
jgi:predicted O-methyltransferase YrrM